MKKYTILEGESKQVGNVTLFRIMATMHIALADGTSVKPGQRGGFIQAEKNLSHSGTCWVAGEAIVSGKASVSGDALVKDSALVCGRAQVYGSAIVAGQSTLTDCSKAIGNAALYNQNLNGIDIVGMQAKETSVQ